MRHVLSWSITSPPRSIPLLADTSITVRDARLPEVTHSDATARKPPRLPPADFRLIAVGGALSSGFRNGGLYREGQEWAFPNLIARQMRVLFEQPLFSKSNGNGTGYFILQRSDGNTFQKKWVENNLALLNSPNTLEPYYGKTLNNFSIPFFSRRMDSSSPLFPKSQPFIKRLNSNSTETILLRDWLTNINLESDLFLFEAGFDDLVESILRDGPGISQLTLEMLDDTDEVKMIARLVEKGKKGVVLNVPDALSLPYFQQYRWDIIKHRSISLKVRRATSLLPVDFDPQIDHLLPGPTAEKIMSGQLSGVIYLDDREVISEDPYDNEKLLASPVSFNLYKIDRVAKKFNLAVVDLYSLYSSIMAGVYQTDDGVKLDPSWPDGNFFSADGIYPTSLGQAVIANECIKVINRHYGLSIPLIPTRGI